MGSWLLYQKRKKEEERQNPTPAKRRQTAEEVYGMPEGADLTRHLQVTGKLPASTARKPAQGAASINEGRGNLPFTVKTAAEALQRIALKAPASTQNKATKGGRENDNMARLKQAEQYQSSLRSRVYAPTEADQKRIGQVGAENWRRELIGQAEALDTRLKSMRLQQAHDIVNAVKEQKGYNAPGYQEAARRQKDTAGQAAARREEIRRLEREYAEKSKQYYASREAGGYNWIETPKQQQALQELEGLQQRITKAKGAIKQGKMEIESGWDRWMELASKDGRLTEAEQAEAREAAKLLRKHRMGEDGNLDRLALASILENRSNSGSSMMAGLVSAIPGVEHLLNRAGATASQQAAQVVENESLASALGRNNPYQDVQGANPKANLLGRIAGNVAVTAGVGNAVNAATQYSLTIAKMAPWVQQIIRSAGTFGATEALQSAGNIQTPGEWDAAENEKAEAARAAGQAYDPQPYSLPGQLLNVGRRAGTAALGGGAGGAVGYGVGKATGSLLLKTGLQVPFMEAVRQTLSGTASAAANTGTVYALTPADQKPGKEQVMQDVAVAFILSALTSSVETYKTTQANKQALDGIVASMQREYGRTLTAARTPAEQAAALERVENLTAQARQLLGRNYMAGQQKYINSILDGLDAMDEQVAMARQRLGAPLGIDGSSGLPMQTSPQPIPPAPAPKPIPPAPAPRPIPYAKGSPEEAAYKARRAAIDGQGGSGYTGMQENNAKGAVQYGREETAEVGNGTGAGDDAGRAGAIPGGYERISGQEGSGAAAETGERALNTAHSAEYAGRTVTRDDAGREAGNYDISTEIGRIPKNSQRTPQKRERKVERLGESYDGEGTTGIQAMDQSDTGSGRRQSAAYARTAEEKGSFLERAQREQKTTREIGRLIYAYENTPEEMVNSNVIATVNELHKWGVSDITVISGPPQANDGAFTETSSGEATTLSNGGILLQNNAVLFPLEIAGHEGFHHKMKKGEVTAIQFVDAVQNNIDFSKGDALEYASLLSDAYFGKDFDITTDYRGLYSELAGYLSGRLNLDINETVDRFGEWFRDTNEVVDAWMQMRPQEADNQGDFGRNTVGAAERNSDSYGAKQTKYGTIPPGEKPARTVDVPKRVDDDTKVRRFTRTAMEAEATPEDMLSDFEKEILDGTFSYEPIGDQGSIDRAEQTIRRDGYNGAVAQWEAVVNGRKVADKYDIALGEMLYAEAAKAGDTKTAMKLAAEIAAEGTRAGQNVQAIRLLKKMTPEGQLYYIRKALANEQKDLDRRYKRKSPMLEIDENLATELLKAKTPKQVDEAAFKIFQDIAQQIPATWQDKWNAWRYLAMLGNPRTHVRNILGNAAFDLVRRTKNLVGYAGEQLLLPKDAEHTKALAPGKAQKDFARQDFEQVKQELQSGGKYNPADILRDGRRIFDTEILEKLRKLNTGALETEDLWFLKNAYTDSLAQYLKANNIEPRTLNGSSKLANAALEKARRYAMNEAWKATFRDASRVASALNKVKKTNAVTEFIGEGLLPFTKTPTNIIKRGVEYSPAGLIKGAIELAQAKRNAGNPDYHGKTYAEGIDSLAAGLTGTGLTILGYFLASMGVLIGSGDEDQKKRAHDELQGRQGYSLELGDNSYTMDWLAPAALPLFVGAQIHQMAAQKSGIQPRDFLQGMAQITEPVFSMTMMQSIERAFQNATYGDANPITNLLEGAAFDYIGQGIPSLLGAGARIYDDTRRLTSYDDKTQGILPRSVQNAARRNLSKIPWASTKLQPKVDLWGREMKQGSLPQRIIENLASPGYYEKRNSTAVDKELDRLYKAVGDNGVLPSYASKSVTINSEKYFLSPERYTAACKVKGQTAFAVLHEAMGQADYKALDDRMKANVVGKAYDYAGQVSKMAVSDYEPDNWVASAQLGEKEYDIPVSTFIILRAKKAEFSDDKWTDRDGEPVRNSTALRMREIIDQYDLTRKQKQFLYEALDIGKEVREMASGEVKSGLRQARRAAGK